MADLIVPPQLAKRIYDIASEEKRPVEDVLASMVNRYAGTGENKQVIEILAAGGLTMPSGEFVEPPLSDEEDQELADFWGTTGRPLSEIILEERGQGY